MTPIKSATTAIGDMTKAIYDPDLDERIEKDALEWTLGKLLRGAGAGADPTEITPGSLTATCIVVANNAKAQTKTWATILQTAGYPVWVCDGAADDAQIQAAIDALTAERTWKEKIVCIGSFTIAAPINMASYTILELLGKMTLAAGVNASIIDVDGKQDWEVVGGEYDGNKANQQAPVIEASTIDLHGGNLRGLIENVYVHDSCWTGIGGTGSVAEIEITIRNCTANDNGESAEAGDGIGIGCFQDGLIEGNVCKGNFCRGIYGCSKVIRTKVVNNYVYDNFSTNLSFEGVDADTICYDNLIQGNICKAPQTNDGIAVGAYATRTTIKGNIVLAAQRYGIFVDGGGTQNQVEGNTILDAGSQGIRSLSPETIIKGNVVVKSGDSGILVGDSADHIIAGNLVKNSQTKFGIDLAGATLRTIVSNNRCFDDQETKTQEYGIAEHPAADYNTIQNNIVVGNLHGGISKLGAHTIMRNNLGYATENSGTATITAEQTSVDVSHGLATTPTRVVLTPTTDTAGKRYWVSAKAAATFTITIDGAHAADIVFDWRAQIGEG